MDEDKQRWLTEISMQQFRDLHGSNAYSYAYKNPKTNKWVTFGDIDRMHIAGHIKSGKLAKQLRLIK